jgi:hypothetical protein
MDSTQVRDANVKAASVRPKLFLSAAAVALMLAAPPGDRASAMNLSSVGGVKVGAIRVKTPAPVVHPVPIAVVHAPGPAVSGVHSKVFVPHNNIDLTNAERVNPGKLDLCDRDHRDRDRRVERERCDPVVNNGGDQPGEGNRRFPHHPAFTQPPVLTINPTVVTTEPPSGPNAQVLRRAGSGEPPADERRFVFDEIVVEHPTTTTAAQFDAFGRKFHLTRLQTVTFGLGGTTLARWRITDRRSVPTMVHVVETDPTPVIKSMVLSVQPNYRFVMQDDGALPAAPTEGDPAQYILDKMHLPQAHELARGDRVLVAVIDSGVDTTNPDLAGDIAGTFDAVGSGPGSFKPHSHGTAIAGAIAAHGRLMGAAPAAQILAVRAFSGDTADEGTTFAIMSGLNWAVGHGARIVNMSFAGPQDPGIARTLAAAHDRGVVLVAAAGNKGAKSPPLYPAADPNVIAVTATDSADHIFKMANRGRYIAVAAPGVDILALAPDGAYRLSTGTSIAAAHVSGIAALLLERKPSLKPSDIRAILIATAKAPGPPTPDSDFGAGLVSAYRALAALDRTPPDGKDENAQAKQ